MVSVVRLFASISLVCLLVTLTVAQGLMRGHDANGKMTLVICTGEGTQTITIDANGTPVAVKPDCPDTQTLSLTDLGKAKSAGILAEFSDAQVTRFAASAPLQRHPIGTAPRGPPVGI